MEHWCDVIKPATTRHRTGSVHHHLEPSNDLRCGSMQDGIAVVDTQWLIAFRRAPRLSDPL